jgi:hypothetical protein
MISTTWSASGWLATAARRSAKPPVWSRIRVEGAKVRKVIAWTSIELTRK